MKSPLSKRGDFCYNSIMKIGNLILNLGIIWAPFFLIFLILLLTAARRFFRGQKLFAFLRLDYFTTRRLIIFYLSAALLFKLFLTAWQYYVWRMSDLGQYLLPPYQPWGYFIRYAFWHFWLPAVLALFFALGLYLIFYAAKRWRPKIISSADLRLLFLMALLAGWPKFLIFFPIFLVIALFMATIKTFGRKEKEAVTLAWPAIGAMFLTLFFGNYLIIVLGLSA